MGKVYFYGEIKEEHIFYDSPSTPYNPSAFSLLHFPHSCTYPPPPHCFLF